MGTKPIKLIVICIAAVAIMSLLGGFVLFWYDRKGGELMLATAGTGIGGLIALLSSTRSQHDDGEPPVPVIAAATLPVKEQVTQQQQQETQQEQQQT